MEVRTYLPVFPDWTCFRVAMFRSLGRCSASRLRALCASVHLFVRNEALGSEPLLFGIEKARSGKAKLFMLGDIPAEPLPRCKPLGFPVKRLAHTSSQDSLGHKQVRSILIGTDGTSGLFIYQPRRILTALDATSQLGCCWKTSAILKT